MPAAPVPPAPPSAPEQRSESASVVSTIVSGPVTWPGETIGVASADATATPVESNPHAATSTSPETSFETYTPSFACPAVTSPSINHRPV